MAVAASRVSEIFAAGTTDRGSGTPRADAAGERDARGPSSHQIGRRLSRGAGPATLNVRENDGYRVGSHDQVNVWPGMEPLILSLIHI